MKKKVILPIISGLAIILLSASTVVNSAGVANWTGSPVDGGTGPAGTCANCHSGGSSTPTLTVTTTPALGAGNTYTPNQTYTITVTPSGSYSGYGFNMEIINSQSTSTSSVANFGTWGAALTSNCKVFTATQDAPYPGCASHNTTSTSAWKCKWTAPASGTGYLYCVVNGVNGDGNTSGDKVSAVKSMTLTPTSSSGIVSHNENEIGLNIFPNPATDNVRLTYMLTERSNISVKLYNINGDLVADLINETQDQGMQSVDTRLPMGLAKGIYMVKLSVNGKLITQKLMVF